MLGQYYVSDQNKLRMYHVAQYNHVVIVKASIPMIQQMWGTS